jgi:hypothetical protein
VIEIPHGVAEDTPSPCWISVVSREGNLLKPVIRCNCGKYCGIGLHHVHADGTVTASFLHTKADFVHNGKNYSGDPAGCEWHVWLKLMDYNLGEFLPTP